MDEAVHVRRMVLLRRPPERVWTALRDELPAVGAFMGGIDSIRLLEREEDGVGLVRTVNEWTAATPLPSLLATRADGSALTWIERARWSDAELESRWTVESRLLGDGLSASGRTWLSPAMGGRGTRVQFEVTARLAAGALDPLAQGRIKAGIREAAALILAKTLQDLVAGVDAWLASESGGAPGKGAR